VSYHLCGVVYLDRVLRVRRKQSPQTIAVLAVLAREPGRERYGYDLSRELALKSGSLYPILIRLSDRAWVEASWEADPPQGRPRRHSYRILAPGQRALREAVVYRQQVSAERSVPARNLPGLEAG
jgi:PadR family transcriptional regulator PadR